MPISSAITEMSCFLYHRINNCHSSTKEVSIPPFLWPKNMVETFILRSRNNLFQNMQISFAITDFFLFPV